MLQVGVIWRSHPRGVAIVSIIVGITLTAAHPALVIFRGWRYEYAPEQLFLRLRRALSPRDAPGRRILLMGGVSTVALAFLLHIYWSGIGAKGVGAALAASFVSATSLLATSDCARQFGPEYQLRHTSFAVQVADVAQSVASIMLSEKAATRLVTRWFGVCIEPRHDTVTTTRSGRQALVGVGVSLVMMINGVAGALEDTVPVGRPSALVPPDSPSLPSASPAGAPPPGASQEHPPSSNNDTTHTSTRSAAEVCHGDPRETLRDLFGKGNQAAADGAASAIEFMGPNSTGCPGPKPFEVSNFIVVPLVAVPGGEASYVAIDRLGQATVIEPAAFDVFGQPDPAARNGFRAGVLSDPALIRIDGPYANAPSPTDRTPEPQRGDRKAFLFILHNQNGSCAAAFRTEPQKRYLWMPPSAAALTSGIAVEEGFVLVTSSPTGFTVDTYDLTSGFLDRFRIDYQASVATTTASFGASPLSTHDSDPCDIHSMRTKRYPFR